MGQIAKAGHQGNAVRDDQGCTSSKSRVPPGTPDSSHRAPNASLWPNRLLWSPGQEPRYLRRLAVLSSSDHQERAVDYLAARRVRSASPPGSPRWEADCQLRRASLVLSSSPPSSPRRKADCQLQRPHSILLPHRRARPGGRLIVSYSGPHSILVPHRRARPGGRLIVSYSGPYSFGLRHRRAWLGCDQWQSTRFAKPQGRVTRPDIASGSASFPPAPDRLPSVAVDAVAPSHVLATRKPKSGSRLTG
jgi:hypothetical protein